MSERPPITYEDSTRDARDDDPSVRRTLAGREDSRPEILYFLALDHEVEVRRAVAANPSAPVQARRLLARDSDEGVRRALAAKLARLLPDLAPEQRGRLYRHAVEVLTTLAGDQAVGVREALATSLADVACAPPRLALALATDVAREVAEPILHYCVTLADEDLLRLVAGAAETWRLAAIARRDGLSEPVAAALHGRGEPEVVAALVENPGARIDGETLERIVEESAGRPDWQAALARRPSLPPRLAARLAGFVDQQVLDALRRRPDLDPETAAEVASVVGRRLAYRAAARPDEGGEARARRLHAEGALGEDAVGDALAWRDMEFVRAALSLRAGIPAPRVEAILASGSPKGVTALAWRAGLGMRLALQLQSRGAGIPPRQLLNARNGTDFPMSEIEMAWQLEFHGVEG